MQILFIAGCSFLLQSTNAQENDVDRDAADFLRKARSSENAGQVYDAIANYEAFFEAGGEDVKAAYRLAHLYFKTRDYLNAKNYFDTVLLRKPEKYRDAYYYKGTVQLSLKEYEEAIESLDLFRRVIRGKRDPEQLRRKARTLIDNAEWAMVRRDSIASAQVVNLGKDVNQSHIEFSPFPIDDQTLWYGSFRPDTTGDAANYRQLYVAEQKSEDHWIWKGEVDGPINNSAQHTGNAALSPDGKRVYFTRCGPNWRGQLICAIYVSEKDSGEWGEPEKLPYPINNDNFTATQPAIGTDLRTGADVLYFVSDRTGTRGGLDLWYARYDSRRDQWREPRNIGSRINTRLDECCPFYDEPNRTLYFSSKGHPGYGGFDIFYGNGSMRRYSDIQGMPQPVNSSFDDTYFSTLTGGDDGFFTSNRPGSYEMENGSCCDDIFYVKFNECKKIPLTGIVVNATDRDLYDELNEKYDLNLEYPEDDIPAPGINIQLFLEGEKPGDELLVAYTETDEDGKYRFNLDVNRRYRMVVKNYGIFDRVVSFNTFDRKCEESIDMGVTGVSVLPEIRIRFNVYYEFDKARLTNKAKTTIDSLLVPVFDLFPNAVIEIGSHTDHNGTAEYNMKLSQQRSESVVEYLIKRGISEDRLVAKGYGESQPIAPNTNPDGTDNPEGRQMNRRTELKVVGELGAFYFEDQDE